MGHRHMFSTSQMFETDDDQRWNNAEQPYMHLARAGATENNSLTYPVENMSSNGGHFVSHWYPPPGSNGYSSSSYNVEMPQYQPEALGPSHDHFLHPPASGSFCMAPENYAHLASSSNDGGQPAHEIEGGYFDLTMANGRGPCKRKSPGVPEMCERGAASRNYDAGSSSNFSMSADLWHEKPNTDSLHTPWASPTITPSYRGNSLSIGSDGILRNVRSRSAVDLETNATGTCSSGNPSHQYCTRSQSTDHSRSVDILSQSSSASNMDWNHTLISPAAHGRITIPDSSALSHETANQFIIGSSNAGTPVEIGGYHNDFMETRGSVPENLQGNPTQSVRGVRGRYSERSPPIFTDSSSNLLLGNVATSDEGLQLVAESCTSRCPRPFAPVGWRNGDRNGRTRLLSERFRSLSNEAGVHNQLTSEGLMIVDRSTSYGSRNLFDQHRDMRLDVDSMSYEELLALGERIGNVSTGLSEDRMSKCLTESVYCSSDQFQDEETCVICLEEYKNMEDVGSLKACGHDFHVGCIRKWLSMKNLCPICKASAV